MTKKIIKTELPLESLSKKFEDYYKVGNLYKASWHISPHFFILKDFSFEIRKIEPSVCFVWKFYDLTTNNMDKVSLIVRESDVNQNLEPQAYYKKI